MDVALKTAWCCIGLWLLGSFDRTDGFLDTVYSKRFIYMVQGDKPNAMKAME